MARSIHRRRRPITSAMAGRLRPIFRYSQGRDAYVLRGVGNFLGPVFQVRDGPVVAPGDEPPEQ